MIKRGHYWPFAQGLLGALLLLFCARLVELRAAEESELDFFESRIRPQLVKHCYECHSADADEIKGGLVVDVAAGLRRGGDSGPAILPGKPDESLLIDALRYTSYEMPPSAPLPEAVIRDFEHWIQVGAPDPRSEPMVARKETIDIDEGRKFWAFRPPASQSPPTVDHNSWPENAIDHFVLSRIERAGLEPPQDADPLTMLRRIYFDLVGLPPPPSEVAELQQSPSEAKLDELVDHLLESRQFGVHWGRHWLDVARYADSNGSDFNATFHDAWRYRDYVVNAMNDDKPFDRFMREQIAGDLLPYESDAQRSEQIVATGFLMVGTKMLSERDKEKMTMDVIDEQIDTVGRAFMGMTLGCARCHDHKFDPIPSVDYYALAGIFGSTRTLEGESQKYVSTWPRTELPAAPDHIVAVKAHEMAKEALYKELSRLKKQRSQAETTEALASELQRLDEQILEHERRERTLTENAPSPLPRAIAVAEHGAIEDARLRIRGDHRNLGEQVPRGFLQVVSYAQQPRVARDESGRRQLAEWIASPDHPLTGRVIVNRVWYHMIGEGIVPTVDNFGHLAIDRRILRFWTI